MAIKNLLVTGGTGYIGRAFLQALMAYSKAQPQAELRVKVLVAPDSFSHWRARWPAWIIPVEGRLPDVPNDFGFESPNVLVHLGVKQIDTDDTGFDQVNVKGTRTLLARLKHCRGVIYASSLSVLGQGSQINATEGAAVLPVTALAKSRAAAEQLILDWGEKQLAWALCLRPRFVLGAEDQFVLPGLYRLWCQKRRIGEGEQQFSVISCQDYGQVMLQLIDLMFSERAPQQLPLHLGYKEPISFFAIYNLLHLFAEGRRLNSAEFNMFRRIPVNETLLGLMHWIPLSMLEKKVTQLELVGLDHFSDVTRLESLIGNNITARPTREVIEQIIADWWPQRPEASV